MSKPTDPLKNTEKKINFVFFTDSEKTRHFKMNYNLFRTMAAFVGFFLIALGALSAAGIKALQEKKELTLTVLNLKSYFVEQYFAAHFKSSGMLAATRLEESESHDEPVKVTSSQHQNAHTPSVRSESKSPGRSQTEKEPAAGVSHVLIAKENTYIRDGRFYLTFSLVSDAKKPHTFTQGSVCARIEGDAGSSLSFPTELPNNVPSVTSLACAKGEHVKFNRLRPVKLEFVLPTNSNFHATKALVYFLEEDGKEVSLLKEINLK